MEGVGTTGSTLPPRMGEGVRMPVSELPPVDRVRAEAEISKFRYESLSANSKSTESEQNVVWGPRMTGRQPPLKNFSSGGST